MKLIILLTTALVLGGCTVYNVPHQDPYYHGYQNNPWPVRVPVVQPHYGHPHQHYAPRH